MGSCLGTETRPSHALNQQHTTSTPDKRVANFGKVEEEKRNSWRRSLRESADASNYRSRQSIQREKEDLRHLAKLRQVREQIQRENIELEIAINRLTQEIIVSQSSVGTASLASSNILAATLNPQFDVIGPSREERSSRATSAGSYSVARDESSYYVDESRKYANNDSMPQPQRVSLSTDLTLE